MPNHALEKVERCHGIGPHVDMRIFNTCPHACSSCEVDDGVKSMIGKYPVQRLGVLDIEFEELKSVASAERLEPMIFYSRIVVVVEIVESDDFVTRIQCQLGGARADETGAACDEEIQKEEVGRGTGGFNLHGKAFSVQRIGGCGRKKETLPPPVVTVGFRPHHQTDRLLL